MKAFAIDRYGDLIHRDMPEPVPGPGEVVVAIAAASDNPTHFKRCDGEFKAIRRRTCVDPEDRPGGGVIDDGREGALGLIQSSSAMTSPPELALGADLYAAELAFAKASDALREPRPSWRRASSARELGTRIAPLDKEIARRAREATPMLKTDLT